MSKNKNKNSNYKNNIGKNVEEKPTGKLTPEAIKKIIIISASAVLVICAIIAGVLLSKPKDFVLLDSGPVPDVAYVEMDFGKYGKTIIKIDGKAAPITAKNFLDLVYSGFYDDLSIFRAQRGFVIQGGKNESIKLNPIKGEFKTNGVDNNLTHNRGVISMARTNDPNSATSQFFITLDNSAANSLDGSYAAFGWVVEGMDTVDDIAEALYGHAVDYMGFVNEKDAVRIKSAKIINYEE
jgi:peptidyl-prolyl cis-trans isomerase B (cyclophilin B)